MTRRDHQEERSVTAGSDGPGLPSGWAVRPNDDGEIVLVRDGGELALTATRENGVWRIHGVQQNGEARHVTDIGAVSTRDDAMRQLFSCMERVNTKLERAGPDNHICLVDAVEDVCKHDAATMKHIVQ